MAAETPLRERALHLLRQAVGPTADFREGQMEAIDALVRRRARLLVVQRTGWGKSIVYFLTTRLLRDQGSGPTLLVSPLLALMRNQMATAEKLGIRAATINSSNYSEWDKIARRVRSNEIDILLISPERFANQTFQRDVLAPVSRTAGLFAVDEAHCISDWGHDFRPDYRRITAVLKNLPASIPICATTATANSRVVADVIAQLGPQVEVSRGPLVRSSLRLQTVALPGDAAKLAWLGQHLARFAGSGIVYALTVRWTERIVAWLNVCGISALTYSSHLSHEERHAREAQLLHNKIKALVATTALGMGYDKPDLGFVVHFHQPPSVVHYYQQVGRAGRAIDKAYGIMLSGGDDQDINDYFIEQAFPAEADIQAILGALEESEEGLKAEELEAAVNLSRIRIERVLKTLAVDSPAPVGQLATRWVATPHRYDAERRHKLVEHMNALRRQEQAQMDSYRCHQGCLMEFLSRALDDPEAAPCGSCAPCQGKPDAMREISNEHVNAAAIFLGRSDLPIEPRKQWLSDAIAGPDFQGNIALHVRAEPGRALGLLGDSNAGAKVRQGKYHDGAYPPALVSALADLVARWRPLPPPKWLTCVPSVDHPQLVADLARELAVRLSLPFFAVVHKVRTTKPQKTMENSWQQAHNLEGAFAVDPSKVLPGSVLLVDDIVDSGWTFTVVAALLRMAGSGPVYPLALAASR